MGQPRDGANSGREGGCGLKRAAAGASAPFGAGASRRAASGVAGLPGALPAALAILGAAAALTACPREANAACVVTTGGERELQGRHEDLDHHQPQRSARGFLRPDAALRQWRADRRDDKEGRDGVGLRPLSVRGGSGRAAAAADHGEQRRRGDRQRSVWRAEDRRQWRRRHLYGKRRRRQLEPHRRRALGRRSGRPLFR